MNAAGRACCESDADDGNRFDIAVVGAGSAGFSAAIAAAERGARVALIGHGTIGGTCVNVGCLPSKTLIRAAETVHRGRTASSFAGIRGRIELTDWGALTAQKDALVAALRKAKYSDLLAAYDTVAYIEGRARLTERGVMVDGREITADRIVLATGSSPAVPPIPGIGEVPWLDSAAALALERLPKSLLVVGGGYIGCELAQMFARIGVEVTITCRSRLLPDAEPEISAALTRFFRDEGIEVRDGIQYNRIGPSEHGAALIVEDAGGTVAIKSERVLIAAGRRPNTEGLGLEEAGIALNERGGIAVDEYMRTSRPGVYAAGDVTGRHMFVYMAAYGARIAAENALDGDTRRYDATAMPAVTFTDPQVARVGLTEAEAEAEGFAVRSATLPLEHLPRALAAHDTRGLVKLVAEAESGRLLGAHILAPEGCDSIQTAALAIRQGLTARELSEMVFPYLTTVEGLKLAAQTFEKDVSKLSCCAG